MNRFVAVLIIAVTGLLVIVGLLFADRNPAGQKSPNAVVKILPFPAAPKKMKAQRTMPSITPDPKIDYKIQRMAVDNSIDYKIIDVGPHEPLPDDLKPKRQIIRPFNFRFPKSTLNLNTGTPGKAAATPPGTKQHTPPHNPPTKLKQND